MDGDDSVWQVTCHFPGTGKILMGCVMGTDPRERAEPVLRNHELLPAAYRREALTWREHGCDILVGRLDHPLHHSMYYNRALVFCERLKVL